MLRDDVITMGRVDPGLQLQGDSRLRKAQRIYRVCWRSGRSGSADSARVRSGAAEAGPTEKVRCASARAG